MFEQLEYTEMLLKNSLRTFQSMFTRRRFNLQWPFSLINHQIEIKSTMHSRWLSLSILLKNTVSITVNVSRIPTLSWISRFSGNPSRFRRNFVFTTRYFGFSHTSKNSTVSSFFTSIEKKKFPLPARLIISELWYILEFCKIPMRLFPWFLKFLRNFTFIVLFFARRKSGERLVRSGIYSIEFAFGLISRWRSFESVSRDLIEHLRLKSHCNDRSK